MEKKFPPDPETATVGADERRELMALITRAQTGSRDAYRQLLTRYRPLLESSLSRFVTADTTLQEKEDLREEAERVFLNALISFDVEQDAVDFGLYAKICLRNGLISEWRSMTARRRINVIPLTQDTLIEPNESEDPSAHLMEEERFFGLYRLIRDSLSDMENQVWWLYVTGVEVKEIARRLGRSEKSVHNAIYRIRTKLRRVVSERLEDI